MAELDYAFLADYAKVEVTGSLTSVGASFTHLVVDQVPAQHVMAVAGRIRAHMHETPSLSVTFNSPNQQFHVSIETSLSPGPNARPYEGDKIGLLFATQIMVPLPSAGLYDVAIEIDGESVRVLKFSVETRAADTSA